jgi:hypothetical protein
MRQTLFDFLSHVRACRDLKLCCRRAALTAAFGINKGLSYLLSGNLTVI